MIPILFRTVALPTRRQINAFKRALLADPRPRHGHTDATAPPLGSYVRHLWLGPNDRTPTNILQSPQLNTWPVESIQTLLPLCTSLRSLAILTGCFLQIEPGSRNPTSMVQTLNLTASLTSS